MPEVLVTKGSSIALDSAFAETKRLQITCAEHSSIQEQGSRGVPAFLSLVAQLATLCSLNGPVLVCIHVQGYIGFSARCARALQCWLNVTQQKKIKKIKVALFAVKSIIVA